MDSQHWFMKLSDKCSEWLNRVVNFGSSNMYPIGKEITPRMAHCQIWHAMQTWSGHVGISKVEKKARRRSSDGRADGDDLGN